MKKLFLVIICMFTFLVSGNAQTIFGKWKTIDDDTGEAKSIVEIYEQNGKAYAKVIEILEKENEDKTCEKCKGDNKNKPIKGLVIINGLKQDGDEWNSAKILDPQNGKQYKCYITLEDIDTLKVRGFIGFALIGRTQYWYRVE